MNKQELIQKLESLSNMTLKKSEYYERKNQKINQHLNAGRYLAYEKCLDLIKELEEK